jgi:hypothetical protein
MLAVCDMGKETHRFIVVQGIDREDDINGVRQGAPVARRNEQSISLGLWRQPANNVN